jgi:Ca-activated chloride channel family protein
VAVVTPAPNQLIQLSAGLESAYVLQGSPGEAFLVVNLAAAAAQGQTQRPSMAVALVIDRSGSMSGDKIVNARAAAASFLGNLVDGDVVAIYQYDDRVEQLAPPTVVNPQSRAALMAMVQTLTPRGSTNLFGGLSAGLQALAGPAAERPVRRVVLISDGLANVGPRTAAELGQHAAAGAAQGVAVTTIGVGLDYDEAVMGAIAVRSGGRFYHLQQPGQLAGILQAELNALNATVARNVSLQLTPAPGVQILGASGADLRHHGPLVHLHVGDMLGSQTRQVVIPLRVPTNGQTNRALGTLALSYHRADTSQPLSQQQQLAYQLTSQSTQVQQGVRPHFAVAVETYRAAEARRRAAQLVADGDAEEAGAVLQQQAERTRRRAARLGGSAGAAMSRSSADLRSRGRSVRAARSAPAARAQQLMLEDEALEAAGY